MVRMGKPRVFSGPHALEDFANEMIRAAANTQSAENLLVRRIGLNMLMLLELGTAADTGQARSNWMLTLGGPWSGLNAPFAPGDHLGKGERTNLNVAFALGAAVLAARAPEVPVYITNQAPWVGLMNEGAIKLRPENAPMNPAFIEDAIQTSLENAGRVPVDWFYPWDNAMAESLIAEWA